jgi:UV DNA damage repair endonuclease
MLFPKSLDTFFTAPWIGVGLDIACNAKPLGRDVKARTKTHTHLTAINMTDCITSAKDITGVMILSIAKILAFALSKRYCVQNVSPKIIPSSKSELSILL